MCLRCLPPNHRSLLLWRCPLCAAAWGSSVRRLSKLDGRGRRVAWWRHCREAARPGLPAIAPAFRPSLCLCRFAPSCSFSPSVIANTLQVLAIGVNSLGVG